MYMSCISGTGIYYVCTVYVRDILRSCLQAGQLRSRFERALRRLFRIYDVDRDGLLGDNELNAFQYNSFQVYLSEEDITALNKVSHTPCVCIPLLRGAIVNRTKYC